mgnify:CR=1 FL=1
MTKILIPRSDSVSAKIIEPSDFENLLTSDIVPDYKRSGFTIAAGSGLAISVSSGVIRLKGLYLESSASETVSSLTASDVNYIYVKLARDSASEAESWDFFKNLTGTTPTDAFFIGTATTNGSAVTAVDQTNVIDIAIPKFEHMYYGDGGDGDVTISSNTSISEVKRYNNLTIEDKCVLIFTYESAIPYLLKKPSCNKYYSIWNIGNKKNQNLFIKSLKNQKLNFILMGGEYINLIDIGYEPHKRLPIIHNFIMKNYLLDENVLDWRIYKLKAS